MELQRTHLHGNGEDDYEYDPTNDHGVQLGQLCGGDDTTRFRRASHTAMDRTERHNPVAVETSTVPCVFACATFPSQPLLGTPSPRTQSSCLSLGIAMSSYVSYATRNAVSSRNARLSTLFMRNQTLGLLSVKLTLESLDDAMPAGERVG